MDNTVHFLFQRQSKRINFFSVKDFPLHHNAWPKHREVGFSASVFRDAEFFYLRIWQAEFVAFSYKLENSILNLKLITVH